MSQTNDTLRKREWLSEGLTVERHDGFVRIKQKNEGEFMPEKINVADDTLEDLIDLLDEMNNTTYYPSKR